MSYKKLLFEYHAFASKLTEIQIPDSIQEVMKNHEWKQAIIEKLRTLEKK